MTQGLLTTSPTFRDTIEEIQEALNPHINWNLTHVLQQHPNAPTLDRVDIVQPTLFAVLVALARHWQHHGIHPHAVIGHSQGEIAAAHIAGALTLHDAATITTTRAQALTRLEGHGAMASLKLNAHQTQQLLTTHWPHQLTIAAINSPTTTIVAGDTTPLHQLLHHCTQHHIQARPINVTYASHTHHTDPLQQHLHTHLNHINPQPAHTPFHSTVTTTPLNTTQLTPHYWFQNLRQTVQLHPTITNLLNTHHHTLIEISPHPVLTPSLHETADTHPTNPLITHTLHRNQPDQHTFHTQLAHINTHHPHPTWTTTNNNKK
ncbi:acyltransferase domain-containing protein, partial [Streptomyces sp. NPDC020141]